MINKKRILSCIVLLVFAISGTAVNAQDRSEGSEALEAFLDAY